MNHEVGTRKRLQGNDDQYPVLGLRRASVDTHLYRPFDVMSGAMEIPGHVGVQTPWVVFDIAGGWGDVFMVAGVARELKQAYPQVRIEYHIPEQQSCALENNPDISVVLPTGTGILAEEHYSVGYPSQFGDLWPGASWHWMRILCRALGLNFDPYTLRRSYYHRPKEILWGLDQLQEYERPWVFVHPYSSPWTTTKQWAKENWQDVLPWVPGTVFVLGANDRENNQMPVGDNIVDWQDKHTYRETCALLHHADLVMCMDSSVMHAAEASGASRVITLYGSTTPQMVGLFMDGVVNLEPRIHPCEPDRCWSRTESCDHECINLIQPAEVVSAVRGVFSPGPYLPIEYVIVNWNSSALTNRVLEDLAKTCKTPGYIVTVVDNASSSEDLQQVREALHKWHGGRQRLIINNENRGFPAAVNQGIAQSDAEVVCLLNPDIEIHEAGWDLRLLATFEMLPRVGIVGAGSNEGAYFFAPDKDHCEYSGMTRCDRVNGSCMAIHRRCLNKVPWMDEVYSPGICEETDYCIRAQALGLEVWWIPAEIVHLGGKVVEANEYQWSSGHKKNVGIFDERWKLFEMPFTGNVPKGY